MTTPVIIDLIAAAVFLGFVIAGTCRGLFRTLAGLLVIVLAMTGARMTAQAAAGPAARFLAPAVERRIQRQLDEMMPPASPEPGQMPEDGGLSVESLLELLGVQGDRLEELGARARENIRDTGASVLTAAAQSAAESLLYGVFYMLAFVLYAILLNLAARGLDLMLKLPVLHGANALGGAAVGALEGLLVLFALGLLLQSLGVSLDGSRILRIYMTLLA